MYAIGPTKYDMSAPATLCISLWARKQPVQREGEVQRRVKVCDDGEEGKAQLKEGGWRGFICLFQQALGPTVSQVQRLSSRLSHMLSYVVSSEVIQVPVSTAKYDRRCTRALWVIHITSCENSYTYLTTYASTCTFSIHCSSFKCSTFPPSRRWAEKNRTGPPTTQLVCTARARQVTNWLAMSAATAPLLKSYKYLHIITPCAPSFSVRRDYGILWDSLIAIHFVGPPCRSKNIQSNGIAGQMYMWQMG